MIKDGDDAGYFYLGYMYELGEEVEQDYAKAAQWYKKGADAGNPTCKLNLGCLYINGDGVEADWDLGLKYSLEASEEIADESAAVASINAALLYRLSDKHRDYDKCEEMCLRAIEQDPENEEGYFQLCVEAILGDYSDFVSPHFLERMGKGKFSTVETGRKGAIPIKEALEKYHARFGVAAYERLADFFYELGEEKKKNMGIYVEAVMKSGDWNVASQLYYLAEKEKPFDFNDESQYWDIYKVAELYAFVEHPDRLRGHDHMIKLAENGYKFAFDFLMENNCPYYEKNIPNFYGEDMIYKQTLMGSVSLLNNPLLKEISECEKVSNKDLKRIEELSFFVAVGYERIMLDRFKFFRHDYDNTYEYYDKMDSFDPFAQLSKLRIKEFSLSGLLRSGEEKNVEKSANELSKIAKEYLKLTRYDRGKSEEAIAGLRAVELLKQKSERCPAVLSGNALENVDLTKLGDKMLPFKRNSTNLLNMKIVGVDLNDRKFVKAGIYDHINGHHYSWQRIKEELYCCKGFDFLYRFRAEYPKEVLSSLTFDTDRMCALAEELERLFLSDEQVRALMLYLYETEGKLHKKYMGYVTDECEKIAAKETDGAKKARADYYLFRIYSGKENVKKDIEKSLTHLISAAKGGCADAQYEAAILAKKGKLKKFGVEKGEYAELLRLAADGGNEKAKKKLK